MCAKEYRLMFISFPQFFRKFHAAYVDAVSNPFHVPGKKIASRSFGARVSTIVKSFGSGTSWSNATFVRLSVIKHMCSLPVWQNYSLPCCLSGERDAIGTDCWTKKNRGLFIQNPPQFPSNLSQLSLCSFTLIQHWINIDELKLNPYPKIIQT